LSQDNANFFWDDATNRLGIGTSSPTATLHVAGTVALPNIPTTAAATDEVLRIDPATGEVKRSAAADVISAAGIIRGSYSIPFPLRQLQRYYLRPWRYRAERDCDGDVGETGRWDNLPAHGDRH
jgi:hypothetical protein